MDKIEQLRGAVEAAVAKMERRIADIDALPTNASQRQLADAQAAFDAALEEHDKAVRTWERAHATAQARKRVPAAGTGGAPSDVRVGREPLMYERHTQNERSFFKDLYGFSKNERGARDRLDRHMEEMDVELRDKGERRDLSSTDGAGGEFIPPIWIMDEFVALARAGRPTANIVRHLQLPGNTDSINVPKVATGTTTAAQADLGAVSETDAATTSIATPVITITGQQDVSRQAVDRSVPGLDEILLGDLAADYATKLDVQVLNGSGSGANARGLLQVSGINSSTYTDASPTVPEIWPKGSDIQQQIHTNRFLPPDAWIMHPRRWAWMTAALDSNNRPLFVSDGPGVNAMGIVERVGAENVVGSWHGLPVVLDASVPTTGGAGTNEDVILGIRSADSYLWEEGEPHRATYFEVLSANLAVRFQVWGYAAFCGERYPKSIGKISGSGLVAPTF